MPSVPRPVGLHTEFRTREYTQYADISVFGQTDPLPGGSAVFQFRLADLPNVAAYQALFDVYRIRSVVLSFVPTATQSAVINATEPPGGTNPAYYVPVLHAVTDYDDVTPPTSGALPLMGYSTYRRHLMSTEMQYSLVPRCSTQTVQPGTVTPTVAVQLSADTWCNTQDPGLRFAGVRVWVDPCSTASVALDPMHIKVYAAFDLEFGNKL